MNPKKHLNTAWIALGGNLGDVRASFITARYDLTSSKHRLLKSSSIYQTPAIGPAGQADYLNAVIKISTSSTPESLLKELHTIEDSHGRIRKEHWGARTLDLDLLAYNSGHTALILDTMNLTLPHPRIAERMFVLRPLCDIDANWQHPLLKQSAQKLLNTLLNQGEIAFSEGESW